MVPSTTMIAGKPLVSFLFPIQVLVERASLLLQNVQLKFLNMCKTDIEFLKEDDHVVSFVKVSLLNKDLVP